MRSRFQAAPQAKQERAKYKRQKLQQQDVEEGGGKPAPTIYCKNMAQLKNVDYSAKIIRRTNEDGIVDFKKKLQKIPSFVEITFSK